MEQAKTIPGLRQNLDYKHFQRSVLACEGDRELEF